MAAQHKPTGGGGWGLVAPNRNKIPAALRRQSEPIYRIFFFFLFFPCFVRQPLGPSGARSVDGAMGGWRLGRCGPMASTSVEQRASSTPLRRVGR